MLLEAEHMGGLRVFHHQKNSFDMECKHCALTVVLQTEVHDNFNEDPVPRYRKLIDSKKLIKPEVREVFKTELDKRKPQRNTTYWEMVVSIQEAAEIAAPRNEEDLF